MRKNVCYDINYDLPFDADMQIFTAQLYMYYIVQANDDGVGRYLACVSGSQSRSTIFSNHDQL